MEEQIKYPVQDQIKHEINMLNKKIIQAIEEANEQKKEFLLKIFKTFLSGLELMIRKNDDYTKSQEPLSNFELAEMIGIDVHKSIAVRMLDKISRLCSLLRKGRAAVQEESIKDTIVDAINYLAILHYSLEKNGGNDEN